MRINGMDVIAYLPVYRHGELDHYVVTAEQEHKTVTAHVMTLNDTEWFWGHYFDGADQTVIREEALNDMIERAGYTRR